MYFENRLKGYLSNFCCIIQCFGILQVSHISGGGVRCQSFMTIYSFNSGILIAVSILYYPLFPAAVNKYTLILIL